MKRDRFSEYFFHAIVALMLLVIFIGQSYLMVQHRFSALVAPFESHPEILTHIEEGLWGVWASMLIWPALLFMVLVLDLIRIKKSEKR